MFRKDVTARPRHLPTEGVGFELRSVLRRRVENFDRRHRQLARTCVEHEFEPTDMAAVNDAPTRRRLHFAVLDGQRARRACPRHGAAILRCAVDDGVSSRRCESHRVRLGSARCARTESSRCVRASQATRVAGRRCGEFRRSGLWSRTPSFGVTENVFAPSGTGQTMLPQP